MRPPTHPLTRAALLFGAVLACSVGEALARPAGTASALWSPAAGVAVGGALLTRTPLQRGGAVGIAGVASGAGNLMVGTPLLLALGSALANAVEVAVVAGLLGRSWQRGALGTTARDLGRFLASSAAGAAAAGWCVAGAVAFSGGADLVVTARSVAFSHWSAVLLIVPVLAFGRRDRGDAGWVEVTLQWVLLLVMVGAVFAPGQHLPITQGPLAVLAWTALRGPPRTVTRQLLVLGCAVVTSTALGWGPFGALRGTVAGRPLLPITSAQVFLIVCAGVVLFLTATVAERRDALARLTAMVTCDGLTGLRNRRGFTEDLAAAISSAEHGGTPLTLLVLDLDGFKEVNDVQGHLAGDAVLVAVATRLREAVRREDIVARLGGDEFAVVVRSTERPDGEATACARIKEAVTRPVVVGAATVGVGVSVGAARWHPGATPDALIGAADAAMYADKRGAAARPVPSVTPSG